MKIQESAENYLEAILMIQEQKGSVRSIDVAHHMGFSKPSISRAVGLLRDNGYLAIDDSGLLTLTGEGMQIATAVYEKHKFFTQLLLHVGVDEKTAVEDACRMEHVLSDESFRKIKAFLRNEIVGN